MKKLNKEQLFETVKEGIKEKHLLDYSELIIRLNRDNQFYYNFDSFRSPDDKDFIYSITSEFEELDARNDDGELMDGNEIDEEYLYRIVEEHTQDIISEIDHTLFPPELN